MSDYEMLSLMMSILMVIMTAIGLVTKFFKHK